MSVWAILAAAGRGDRLGLDRPKAFAPLNDRPLSPRASSGSTGRPGIEGIVVAAPPEWEEPCILVAEEVAAGKVAGTVTGRRDRSESVRAALAEVPDDATSCSCTTRPARSSPTSDRAARHGARDGWDAVVPACRRGRRSSASTARRVSETVDRRGLVTVQTPQAFVAPVLATASRG
jgi:2-C-methyl-D-erythritol 4-phosphate cytidylyltransferase